MIAPALALLAAVGMHAALTVHAAHAAHAQDAAAAEHAPSAPVLEFHNGFWINLHHVLYQQALEDGPSLGTDADWEAAVAYYRTTFAARDLLFDEGMRALDVVLGEAGSRPDLDGVALDEALRGVLASAAPAYRERSWDAHRAANDAWLARVEPRLDAYFADAAGRLAALLHGRWPETPIRVDLLHYANWAGGYTSYGPDHIRIGVGDDEGPERAFELLLHESGHLVVDALSERIVATCAARGLAPPRGLWHTVLFFTAGEVARRSPATADDYVPYAVGHGLFEGRMAPEARALEAHWPAYVDGEITLDEALARVVDALAASGHLRPTETRQDG